MNNGSIGTIVKINRYNRNYFREVKSYNIYVTNSLVGEVVEGFSEDNLIDYYNQKRKSGELEIEPIGIARKLKMGFINLGLKIASWFS